jgi:hypothetical protein
VLLADDVYNFLFLVVFAGLASSIRSAEDFVNIFIIEVSSTISNLLFKVVSGFVQLSLSSVLLLLLVVLDSFMELFVFKFLLLLLESSDLLLLLEESALDLSHVLVGL